MEVTPKNVKKVPVAGTHLQAKPVVPPQKSAQDTSNWDKKELTAPNGRVIIETQEKIAKGRTVISE